MAKTTRRMRGVTDIDALRIAGEEVTASAGELSALDGLTASATELNLIDGSLAGTAVASKALVLGANKNVDTLVIADGGLKLGAGAGTAVTPTAAELNFVDGVTSAIQTQIDGKSATGHTHTLANVTDLTATAAEVNLLDGMAAAQTTITVGAEATNVIRATLQLKDANDANVASSRMIRAWLSGVNTVPYATVATAPNGGVAIGTKGAIITELVAEKVFLCTTDAAGALELDITDTGTPTFYLIVELPNGTLEISSAITFA